MSNQFNYNLNSINFFVQENSGSITGVTTEFEDYGDVQGLPVQTAGQVWLPEREESIHDFSFNDVKFFNTFDSELTRFDTNLELEDWGADLNITETLYPFGTLSSANLAGLAESFNVSISGLAILFRAIGNLGIALHPDTLLVVQRHYLAMVASAESVISSPVVLYSNSVLPVSPSPLTSLAAVLRPSQCCCRTHSNR